METTLKKPHHTSTDTPALCESCGHVVTEKFCGHCGEKLVDDHDFALKHYLEESVEGITHFDNKFFRTARVLITSPGLLTQYFSKGRRMAYLKPFQLFLICNIVFFLLAGKLNIFSQSISNFYNYQPYTYFHTQETIKARAHNAEGYEKMALSFNERVGTESKVYIVAFIPVFALLFALLFAGKKKYFSEHLVFATHFFSFILLLYTAFTILVMKPFYYFSHKNFSSKFDIITTAGCLLVIAIYFSLAARRFYNANRWLMIPKALFAMVFFTMALYAYRLMLFYKIIYSLH